MDYSTCQNPYGLMATCLFMSIFQLVRDPPAQVGRSSVSHFELPGLPFDLNYLRILQLTQLKVGGWDVVVSTHPLLSPSLPLCCCGSWACGVNGRSSVPPSHPVVKNPKLLWCSCCAQHRLPTGSCSPEDWVPRHFCHMCTTAVCPVGWSQFNRSLHPISTRYVYFRDFICLLLKHTAFLIHHKKVSEWKYDIAELGAWIPYAAQTVDLLQHVIAGRVPRKCDIPRLNGTKGKLPELDIVR